jgi:ABC-type phosphate transport system substrate-binding protein
MLVCRSAGQDGASYYIVVHPGNPAVSMTKEQISKLFLKKGTSWPHGRRAYPVDLLESSAVRQKFSKEIHGKTVASIKAFWQQRIFSGREVPPPEKASDADVVAFVHENPDAIGYVSANAVTLKVRVLQVKP